MQVHRATLRDGTEVVVKVQRPGLEVKVLLSHLLDVLDVVTAVVVTFVTMQTMLRARRLSSRPSSRP
jgi:predicted unusual protein kinase regulating ubiquinone biosynthesis (AarF/ABC1/UbiB family)